MTVPTIDMCQISIIHGDTPGNTHRPSFLPQSTFSFSFQFPLPVIVSRSPQHNDFQFTNGVVQATRWSFSSAQFIELSRESTWTTNTLFELPAWGNNVSPIRLMRLGVELFDPKLILTFTLGENVKCLTNPPLLHCLVHYPHICL